MILFSAFLPVLTGNQNRFGSTRRCVLDENSVALLGTVRLKLVQDASNEPLTYLINEDYKCVYMMSIAI